MSERRLRKDKKLTLVRSDLLEKIIEIANKEGKPVFSLTNEIFEQAIRAYEMKTSLTQIVDFYSLIKLERETGAVIVPSDLLYYLIGKLYQVDKESLIEKWFKAGQWYGKYLQAKFPDPVEAFRSLLTACTWDASEIQLTRKNGSIILRCIAPHFSIENTELFSKFLEGTMNSLGYKTLKNEHLKGMIILEFEKES